MVLNSLSQSGHSFHFRALDTARESTCDSLLPPRNRGTPRVEAATVLDMCPLSAFSISLLLVGPLLTKSVRGEREKDFKVKVFVTLIAISSVFWLEDNHHRDSGVEG